MLTFDPYIPLSLWLPLTILAVAALVGYGYTNVWELGAVMRMDEVEWVSSDG